MNATQETLRAQLQFGLGDRLAKALHVSGVTNQDMADELEVSRNTVTNYINGHTKPKGLYLRIWALKTGVPLEWLETGNFPDTGETEKAPTPKGEGMEPPSRLELDTYALQGGHMAEIIPIRAA